MKIAVLVYIAFLSLFIVGLVHRYEDKIKDLKLAIEDYKKALRLSDNTEHYTHLQLENQRLTKAAHYEAKHIQDLTRHNQELTEQVRYMDGDSKALNMLVNRLAKENEELKNGTYGQYKGYSIKGGNAPDIQYESSVYKSTQWTPEYKDTDRIIEL